jgi:ribose 1,5-bisphosphokinase PhnN
MTDGRPALNPFSLPELFGARVPLRPWQISSHEPYYVPVGNTQVAFDEFTRRMDTLTTLQREGQLVLVAGESGCGKTALINRCAWHVRKKLAAAETTGVVVNLQRALTGMHVAPGNERFAFVLHQLCAELDSEGALRQDADAIARKYEGQPEAIYRQLHNMLQPKHVAIVLLPPSDLPDDVVRYGALSCRKVLFLTEFVYGSHPKDVVDEIVAELERDAPPVTLRLGGLKSGDVPMYIKDRLKRHESEGKFPRMTNETMETLDLMLQSVAQMQSACHEVYEQRLVHGLEYDESSFVDLPEIAKVMKDLASSRRGKA